MDFSRKVVDKFNHSPRKKSMVQLERKSSSDTDDSETEISIESASRRDRKESSSIKSSSRMPSSTTAMDTKKKKRKKRESTIEEDLASTGYVVSPKMLAVANISKKHTLRSELVMLNYLDALSEKLCAQEQAIQLLQVEMRNLQETQRQETLRRIQEEARLQYKKEQQAASNNNFLSRLFSSSDDEECTLF